MGIDDDRGYQYFAGIHGLPLPICCQHHNLLFLPWHRAYLYFFEQSLLDQVATVPLPWWDWAIGMRKGARPYDWRLPHQLTPASRLIIVTENLRQLLEQGQQSIVVSVVPIPTRPGRDDVLNIERAGLVLYTWP